MDFSSLLGGGGDSGGSAGAPGIGGSGKGASGAATIFGDANNDTGGLSPLLVGGLAVLGLLIVGFIVWNIAKK